MGSTNKMFYLGEGPENGSASPEQGVTTAPFVEPPPSYAQSQAGYSSSQAAPKYPQTLPGHVQPLTPPQAPLQTVSGQVQAPMSHNVYRATAPATPSTSGLAGANYPRQPPVPSLVGSASYPGQFTSIQNGTPGSSGPPPPPPGLPAETNTKKKSTCMKVSGGVGIAVLVIWIIFRFCFRVALEAST
ncbi:splicing factor 3B subunit 4-like [Penaeus monodon]|uniref:splicing factor 3B subunit 4-like n=1 Tax=Penaeus monodon TaxID=6687 RepID=UPI0018A74962|nr:splicing factor 3B subunit 4-like [Penaeus monodon]XP_037798322.1 splicing factor 3B subunit 4-like [Penaeus monodon]XP_037798330.1 splicing factor 3B subunit 4-like [Penaeus monodon]